MGRKRLQQHEKAGRPRRDRSRKSRAGQALAAGAAIAAGTHAYAKPIRFDNPPHGAPGHFEWQPQGPGQSTWLIQTQPAWDQDFTYPYYGFVWQRYGADSVVTLGVSYGSMRWHWHNGFPLFVETFEAGEIIDSSGNWGGGLVYTRAWGLAFEPGVRTYLGNANWIYHNGDAHFGWLGVEMNPVTHTLELFAWGYESEPYTPISAGAPEPGSLAMLAFGAAIASCRRRGKRLPS